MKRRRSLLGWRGQLAVLWAAACSAFCAVPGPLVPMVLRPDTRRLTSFAMDSVMIRAAVERFVAVLPKEAALCLDGTIHRDPATLALHVEIDSVRSAQQDSADQFHVYLTGRPVAGCTRGRLLAIAHDHTSVPADRPCDHSDPDVFVLFNDTRALFSLVFCGDGRGSVLFQDGRRGEFRWTPPEPAEP